MKIRQVLQRVRQSLKAQQPVRRPKKARRLLLLEGLEERTLPTVSYNPVFGAETFKPDDDGDRLNSAPVYIILWGAYWNGANTPQANIVAQAAAGEEAAYVCGLAH